MNLSTIVLILISILVFTFVAFKLFFMNKDQSIFKMFSHPFSTLHYDSEYDKATVYHTLDN